MMRFVLAGLTVVAVAAGATGQSSPPTFSNDVLPILQKNCQICHRPGQVAPMSLVTYKDARAGAKAIKAAETVRKMPPWLADPQYGHFKKDRSLKQREVDTVER